MENKARQVCLFPDCKNASEALKTQKASFAQKKAEKRAENDFRSEFLRKEFEDFCENGPNREKNELDFSFFPVEKGFGEANALFKLKVHERISALNLRKICKVHAFFVSKLQKLVDQSFFDQIREEDEVFLDEFFEKNLDFLFVNDVFLEMTVEKYKSDAENAKTGAENAKTDAFKQFSAKLFLNVNLEKYLKQKQIGESAAQILANSLYFFVLKSLKSEKLGQNFADLKTILSLSLGKCEGCCGSPEFKDFVEEKLREIGTFPQNFDDFRSQNAFFYFFSLVNIFFYFHFSEEIFVTFAKITREGLKNFTIPTQQIILMTLLNQRAARKLPDDAEVLELLEQNEHVLAPKRKYLYYD